MQVVKADHATRKMSEMGPEQGIFFHIIPDVAADVRVGMVIIYFYEVPPFQPGVHMPAACTLQTISLALVRNYPLRTHLHHFAPDTNVIKDKVEAKPDPQVFCFFNKFFKVGKSVSVIFSTIGLVNGKEIV